VKLSLRMTVVAGLIFALICLGVAITGLMSLGDIEDPVRLSDAKGFAGFWAFLGAVALGFAALAWWMQGSEKDE
jgi:hypothetical protein